jgi:hypothetical protein
MHYVKGRTVIREREKQRKTDKDTGLGYWSGRVVDVTEFNKQNRRYTVDEIKEASMQMKNDGLLVELSHVRYGCFGKLILTILNYMTQLICRRGERGKARVECDKVDMLAQTTEQQLAFSEKLRSVGVFANEYQRQFTKTGPMRRKVLESIPFISFH